MRSIGVGACLALLWLTQGAASPPSTMNRFVTTVGKDTTAVEEFSRTGDTVTGDWVTRQGAVLHHYTLTLGPDGLPVQYEIALRRLGAPRPLNPSHVRVTYSPDSATIVLTMTDSTMTRRVAMTGTFPLIGSSLMGLDLALTRLRATHPDSGNIRVHFPTRPAIAPMTMVVRFFAGDSIRLAGPTGFLSVRLDAQRQLLAVRAGASETRRVPTFDLWRI